MLSYFRYLSTKCALPIMYFLVLFSFSNQTIAKIRIVILPHYAENGVETEDNNSVFEYYMRIERYVSNKLHQGFDVIYRNHSQETYVKHTYQIMQLVLEDTSRAVIQITNRYETDVAYIVWLEVYKQVAADGVCKVTAVFAGEGYDNAARNLGINVAKTITRNNNDCDMAIRKAIGEFAVLVGKKLTTWHSRIRRSIESNPPVVPH